MNKKQITFFLALFTTISCNTYAGNWINWDVLITDISQGIHSIVNSITNIISTNKTRIVGTGVITTKQIAISGIDSVKLSGLGSLIITQNTDQPEGLVIEADEAIMPYIDVQIKNSKLIIKTKENISFQLKNPIIYRFNSKTITNIDVSGSVSVDLINCNTQTLSLTTSGSSQITGTIVTKELSIDSSGACTIILSGKADTQTIKSSGSSKFDGRNLNGKNISIDGSGAVKLYCNASKSITGNLSGVGSLFYSDSCSSINVDTSGVVSIKKFSSIA